MYVRVTYLCDCVCVCVHTHACMFVRMFVPVIAGQHRSNQVVVLIEEIYSLNLYLQHLSLS